MNPQELSGKTAVITGASRGLGRAMALSLAGAGASLALIGRDRVKLAETAAAVRAAGAAAEVFQADVSREEEVVRLEKEVSAKYKDTHILINNAGINIRKPLVEFTAAEWNQVLQTNLTGAFYMCRSFIPRMKGHGYGRIINLTSIMSHVALAGRSAYAASKAGLLGMTRALALELAADSITVNAISPGPVATELNTPILKNEELNRQFVSRIPMGRWGKEEEIGRAALYLCSELAGFMTGTDLVIDGGWCAQ